MSNSELPEKQSYIITSFAPLEITQKFSEIKKTFHAYLEQNLTHENSVITKTTAHITLKRPFLLKDSVSEAEIIHALDRVSFSPIFVTASELKLFHSETFGNILVALVDKSAELQSLHESISRELRAYIAFNPAYEGTNFTPHLSLLYTLSESAVEKAQEYITQNFLPVTYTLDNMSLLGDIANVRYERRFVKKYFADTASSQ